MTNRLTLNLGIRYELPIPLYDKLGRVANYVPELNKLVICSATGLAPGVGFANASSVETAQQAGIPSANCCEARPTSELLRWSGRIGTSGKNP